MLRLFRLARDSGSVFRRRGTALLDHPWIPRGQWPVLGCNVFVDFIVGSWCASLTFLGVVLVLLILHYWIVVSADYTSLRVLCCLDHGQCLCRLFISSWFGGSSGAF